MRHDWISVCCQVSLVFTFFGPGDGKSLLPFISAQAAGGSLGAVGNKAPLLLELNSDIVLWY